MSWEFIAFLGITLVRQVPQFWLEYKSRGTRVIRATGIRSTVAMFALYFGIWIPSLVVLLFTTPGVLLVGLGTALLVVGTGARFVALAQLGLVYNGAIVIREGHELRTAGIYRLVRHPLHLALFIELLGMMVYTGSWWLLPLWAVLLGVVYARNIHEDRELVAAFGDAALKYPATPGMNPLAHLTRWLGRRAASAE